MKKRRKGSAAEREATRKRVAETRARMRRGLVVYRIEADPAVVEDTLALLHFISRARDHTHQEIEAALSAMLAEIRITR